MLAVGKDLVEIVSSSKSSIFHHLIYQKGKEIFLKVLKMAKISYTQKMKQGFGGLELSILLHLTFEYNK